MSVTPECLACGVCCFSRLENYVRVTGADYARLGGRDDELAHFDGMQAYMRMVDGHCIALLAQANGEWACSAYDVRPQTCRDLERGSAECLGEIAEKAERPAALMLKLRLPVFRGSS
jgi:uncharacterized protein